MISNYIKLEKTSLKIISSLFTLYMFFAFVFSRSFVGIYIFNVRIGEFFVGLTFILFLYVIFFNSKNTKLIYFDQKFRLINFFIFLSFLIVAYVSDSNFYSSYTYKTSTYIWTFSLFFLGAYSKKLRLNLKLVVIIEVVLLSIFFTSIYDFPDSLIQFFTNYSDKYEPHKGSDLAIFFLLTNLLINNFFRHNRTSLNIYIVNLGFFLPLILYRSRGAFIGVMIFVIYQLNIFLKNKMLISKRTVPLLILFLTIATYSTLVSQVKDFPEEISAEVIANSYASLGEYRLQHYQEDYPILYLENGRVYSGDGNLNWRLAMWQDQIEYMNNEKLIYYGSGYKDRLFVFSVDNTGYGNDRTGLDKTNENIHNYFVQIFSRGGLLHLLMFIILYFYIFRIYYVNTAKKDILFFALPILWVSLFDSSMENAHFPIIFYYFLGNLFFSNKYN